MDETWNYLRVAETDDIVLQVNGHLFQRIDSKIAAQKKATHMQAV